MTPQNARTVANLVLASAGVAAAYVVFTSPPLRRIAITAAERWLGASVPAYLMNEARRAWAATAQPADT